MRLPITSLLLVAVGWTVTAHAQAPAAAPAALDVEVVKKSCDKGNAADCLTLAAAHQSGEGAPRDAGKASGFYKKAATASRPRAASSWPRCTWPGRAARRT